MTRHDVTKAIDRSLTVKVSVPATIDLGRGVAGVGLGWVPEEQGGPRRVLLIHRRDGQPVEIGSDVAIPENIERAAAIVFWTPESVDLVIEQLAKIRAAIVGTLDGLPEPGPQSAP